MLGDLILAIRFWSGLIKRLFPKRKRDMQPDPTTVTMQERCRQGLLSPTEYYSWLVDRGWSHENAAKWVNYTLMTRYKDGEK